MSKFKIQCPYCKEMIPGTWADIIAHDCPVAKAIREQLKSS